MTTPARNNIVLSLIYVEIRSVCHVHRRKQTSPFGSSFTILVNYTVKQLSRIVVGVEASCTIITSRIVYHAYKIDNTNENIILSTNGSIYNYYREC